MADNIQYDLNIVDESGSINKLESQLKELTSSMRATSTQLSQFVKNQTRDLEKAFNEANRSGKETEKIWRKLAATQSQVMNNYSRGSPAQQRDEAAVNREIADRFTKTSKGFEMKLTEALVAHQTKIMRTANEAVVARLKKEMDNIDRMVKASTDEIRRATSLNADYRNDKLVRTSDADYQSGRLNKDMVREQGVRNYTTEAMRADVTAQELANLRKQARFNTEEGRLAELKLAQIALQDRLYLAKTKITKEEQAAIKAEEKAVKARLAAARAEERANKPAKPVAEKPGLFDHVNERFNSNGGADIIAIQARLMMGYQALNLFFSAVRNGATFIVALDKELKQFQAITDTSASSMIGFKEQLVEVAQQSKFTAVELAQAATTMGQAGLSSKEVGETLGAVATLAAASGSDLSSAVDVVTSSMSIFNLQTKEAADLANTLTASLNLSKLSIDKIALSMQYAGNIAAESGVGYKELLSIVGTMSNSGIISGSTLGTGLRQLMIDIQNPTEKFKKTLESVGLTEEDVSIRSKTLTGVLRTLHDAGFGTAQAFESFEVRAASAFAALDGNLDSITDMNAQLINSAAATEANAVQMESLANKWSKFGSTAGITLDKMFGGVVEAIKKALDVLTELLISLNKMGPTLRVIGNIMAGAFSIAILAQFVALIKGLAIALGGMIGIVKNAQVAFLGLNLVMKGHPMLILISGLAMAATYLIDFADAADTTAAKLDKVNGEAEDLKGNVDATKQTIKGLNDVAGQLMAQRAALDADPVLRKSRIMEVVNAFKELSTEIDSSTASTENLIDAVNRLTQKQLQIQEGQLRLQASKREDALELEKSLLNSQTQSNVPRLLQSLQGNRMNSLATNPEFSQALMDENWSKVSGFVSKQMQDVLPNQFDPLADQAMGRAPVENMDELILRTGELKKAMEELPAGTSSEVVNIYQTLLTSLEELIPTQQKVNAGLAELNVINKEIGKVAIQNTPAYQTIAGKARKEIEQSELFRTTALGGDSPFSKDQQIGEVTKFRKQLEVTISDLQREAERAGSDVLESFKANVLPALNEQVANLDQAVSKRTEDYFKTRDRAMRAAQGLVKTKITTLANRTAKADTEDMVKTLIDESVAIFDASRKSVTALYQEKMYLSRSDSDKEELTDKYIQDLNELSAEETRVITQMMTRIDTIKDAQVRLQKDQVDDQAKALKTQIDDATEELRKLAPGDAFNNLKASILKMADELQKLRNFSSSLDLQLTAPGMNTIGGATTAATIGADQSKRISAVMGTLMAGDSTLGLQAMSKEQAAGVLGHLMQESGVLANGPSGDDGLANGMAQWHPDRYAAMTKWQGEQGLPNNEIGQSKWLMHELQTKYPKVWGLLQQAKTPEEAARAFAGYEGFKDWDKNTTHAANEYTDRINNANAAYAVNPDNVADVNSIRTGVDTIGRDKLLQLNSTIADGAVKNLTEVLQTQMQQAKNSADPAAVMKIVDTIDDQYNKIIDVRTKEFQTANPTAVAGDEVTTKFNEEIAAIRQDQLQKTTSMVQEYWTTVQAKSEQVVKDAQLRLSEAQKQPEGKYTDAQMAALQNDVTNAEKIAQQQQLAAATMLAARANSEAATAAATYGLNSEQVRYWSEQEAQAKQKVADITSQKNAADAATAKQGPSVAEAIKNANEQWAIQAGLMQRLPGGAMQMVPLATQVGNAWGQVLTGMTDNLTNLFVALADGSMSAKEAFKQFALSTVQMFLQMIAKALAYQLVMSTIGSITPGGSFLSGLFGTPGMANGGAIPGAATGELITGGTANRDSVLRRLMPGEMVLRKSAVSSIGKNNLRNMNALGNRQLNVDNSSLLNPQSEDGSKVVNVWVVSPDQQPQMGPNDIVAVVSDNIKRRGSIKQLIKEVQMGR